eukprot:287863_1
MSSTLLINTAAIHSVESLQQENAILKYKNGVLANLCKDYKLKTECLESNYKFKQTEYESKITDLNQVINDMKRYEITQFKAQMNELNEKNAFLSKQINNHTQKISELNDKRSQQKTEITQLKMKNINIELTLTDTISKLNDQNQNIISKSKIINELKQSLEIKKICNHSRQTSDSTKWDKTIHINVHSLTHLSTDMFKDPFSESQTELTDINTEPMLLRRYKSDNISPMISTSVTQKYKYTKASLSIDDKLIIIDY